MFWRLLAAIVACFSWSRLSSFGRWLGWFVGSLLRVRRTQVIDTLSRAGIASPREVADRVYANLGTGVFELLWSAGSPALRSDVKVRVEGWAAVEGARAMGRGIVVATAHTGNWDLAACAMAKRVPLTVVTKHLSWRSLDRFWQTLRARRGVHLVDPVGAITHARRRLADGAAVVFLIDQAPMRDRGVEVAPFMGSPADHDATFALVAARCRAPIVLAFPVRLADGTHEVQIRGVIEPPRHPSRAWVRETTLMAAKELEGVIREHPDQWLWLHRRWKRPRAGGVRHVRGDMPAVL